MIKKYVVFFLIISHTISWAQVEDNYRSMLKDTGVVIDKTNLPIVFIDVDGKMILREDYILARMKIIHNGDGMYNYGDTIAYPNQHIDYEGYVALKYRGHSSFGKSNKKPYGFRTLNTSTLPESGGEKKKVSLLGMPKDNKWVLLAPWTDRSMIRDVLSFDLARPWMDFVPDTRFCEVYLDGTYYGIYILTESVSQGKNRLSLKDSNEINNGDETDLLIYIDRGDDPYYESQNHPIGKYGTNFERFIKYEYKFPDYKDFNDLPEGTKDFVDEKVYDLEETFLKPDYTNPLTGYRSKIDVNSFIDYMLSTEISYNVDGYRLSTYLYKHSDSRGVKEGLDSRWKCTIWDFNMAWGNTIYYDHKDNCGWNYDINYRDDFKNDKDWVPFYWSKLLQDQSYVNQLKNRWYQYRKDNYSDDAIICKIDSLTVYLKEGGAVSRNEKAWNIFSTNIWGIGYEINSYEEEISFLKDWIKGRLSFLDNNLGYCRTSIERKNIIAPSKSYYNLNGSLISKEPDKGIYIKEIEGKMTKMIK